MSPEALLSNQPSGVCIRCAMPCLRMLDAVRNAARCVHISAQKYTTMPLTANANAIQPYREISAACVQFGATATRSRTTSQTQR